MRCSMMSMGLPQFGHLNGVLVVGSDLSIVCFLGTAFKRACMTIKVAFARGCMNP